MKTARPSVITPPLLGPDVVAALDAARLGNLVLRQERAVLIMEVQQVTEDARRGSYVFQWAVFVDVSEIQPCTSGRTFVNRPHTKSNFHWATATVEIKLNTLL